MQAEIFRSAHQEHYERTYKGMLHSFNKIANEVSFERNKEHKDHYKFNLF
jgi:hypothetical protein